MTAERYAGLLCLPVIAALLLWPAVWNGYPIVFADTGTYLSQAVHFYLGWDRPPFYSLAILPLHLTWSLWPIVIAQALLTAWVLTLVWRVLVGDARTRPDTPRQWLAIAVVAAALAAATWLPWLVSEVMPDVLTPLLVLVLGLLALAPDRLGRRERSVVLALATFMVTAQTSSLALYLILVLPLLCLMRPRRAAVLRLLAPPGIAAAVMVAVNLAGHGKASPSPFGALFLLARLVDDGPAVSVLRRDCPAAGWRLCGFVDRLPMNSDDFLWRSDSPVVALGGHKTLAPEAAAIVHATIRQEPGAVLRTMLANTGLQLAQFASGDGLASWSAQVAPWIIRDFPASAGAAFAEARQQRGTLSVPDWLAALHLAAALGGVALCAVLLPGTVRRRDPVAGFILLVLAALPVSAAVTGALSGPHDRYQARVMWLPLFVGLAGTTAVTRRAA